MYIHIYVEIERERERDTHTSMCSRCLAYARGGLALGRGGLGGRLVAHHHVEEGGL